MVTCSYLLNNCGNNSIIKSVSPHQRLFGCATVFDNLLLRNNTKDIPPCCPTDPNISLFLPFPLLLKLDRRSAPNQCEDNSVGSIWAGVRRPNDCLQHTHYGFTWCNLSFDSAYLWLRSVNFVLVLLKIDAVVTAEVFSSRRTFLFMMMQILKGKPPSQVFSSGEQCTPLSVCSLIHHPTQAES